jgi:hypothetical protein
LEAEIRLKPDFGLYISGYSLILGQYYQAVALEIDPAALMTPTARPMAGLPAILLRTGIAIPSQAAASPNATRGVAALTN